MNTSERLDEILLRRGWVTESQLVQALEEQKSSGGRLGSVLVRLGFLTETQLAEALAELYGTPVWDPETAVVEERALKLFPEQWLRLKGILPISYDQEKEHLEVAVTDPTNMILTDEIRFHAEIKSLTITVIPEISLRRLWNFYRERKAIGEAGEKAGAKQTGHLGMEFTFGPERSGMPDAAESTPSTGVLLWFSQPFMAKLLKSLLEIEQCRVVSWDGKTIPDGEWHYIIYDDDQSASHPGAAEHLKTTFPNIQFVARPSWTTSLLRSPLSYERLRDGYIHLTEYVSQKFGSGRRDRRLSRYALAVARVLPMSQFEIDSLMTACELAPLLAEEATLPEDWDKIAEELRCPYPVVEVYRGADVPFDRSASKPGESGAETPLTSKVYAVTKAFLLAADRRPVDSMESLSELTEWLRQASGKDFDPVVVEALLRVVQEEVLEGCLPPGPAEVLVVADHAIDWNHLLLQLENEGWRVVKSKGFVEARRQTERRKPDAVVWAADGAFDWIRWQAKSCPGIANFLVLDQPDVAMERMALEAGFEDVWSGSWDAGVAVAKLQRAVVRREKTPEETPAVNGSLQQLGFIDIVQILAAGNRSVRIEITSNQKKAVVILWQGQIKFAQAPGQEGEVAIYDLLTWENGTFNLHPIYAMPPINCKLSNEMILLEGCRILDEKRRAPTEATPV